MDVHSVEDTNKSGTTDHSGPSPILFELSPKKIEVCLRMKGASGRYELTHYLRPPKLEDWRRYEINLKSTVEASEHSPEALQFDSAAMEAAVELYNSLFTEATGYCVTSEGGVVACEQIPAHHKEMVIRALGDVGPETAQNSDGIDDSITPFALDPDRITVTLQAQARGEDFAGLTHMFSPPTAADRIGYSRVVSQALFVRGSQSLKTLLPARLPGLVKLYDQLICEVRGYSVQGQEVSERAAIVKHMDPLHKKAAVQALFEV